MAASHSRSLPSSIHSISTPPRCSRDPVSAFGFQSLRESVSLPKYSTIHPLAIITQMNIITTTEEKSMIKKKNNNNNIHSMTIREEEEPVKVA